MKTVTSTELKTNTAKILAAAQREPVSIEENGIRIAVMLPQADYERLTKLENNYWLARAQHAEAEGYIGADKTTEFFKKMKG